VAQILPRSVMNFGTAVEALQLKFFLLKEFNPCRGLSGSRRRNTGGIRG
jgi:hypothetical protein